MFRKLGFVLILMLCVSGLALAQDAAPLKIGLLTDHSGALAIYGTELDNGFKLGLVYSAGLNPDDYENIDDAVAAVTGLACDASLSATVHIPGCSRADRNRQ